jgi:EAL domain-containing protein (putative c-di-GMP-specific phosphodiesterase class I)
MTSHPAGWTATELAQAAASRQLELYYQPLVDLRNNRIVGAEALLRWRHPSLGLLPPGQFIPLAESSGLMPAIGTWVLCEACRQMRKWQALAWQPFRLAVNVSASQVGPMFDAEIQRVLTDADLPAECLEIELTESVAFGNPALFATFDALRALGVHFAADDFGTGYSCLQHLKCCPITTLKIDQSFVARLPDDTPSGSRTFALSTNGGDRAHARYRVCRVMPSSWHKSPTLVSGLPHCRHRQAQLGGRHLERPAAFPAARPCRRQARHGALGDQLALELGQRGEDAEDQLAGGGRGVDGRTVAGQHLQADTAPGQVVHGVDQMAQVAPEPIQFPHHQRIPFAQRLQAARQAGAILALAGRLILVEMRRIDASSDQRIALQVGGLGAVRLRYPHVANQHLAPVTYTFDYVTVCTGKFWSSKFVT